MVVSFSWNVWPKTPRASLSRKPTAYTSSGQHWRQFSVTAERLVWSPRNGTRLEDFTSDPMPPHIDEKKLQKAFILWPQFTTFHTQAYANCNVAHMKCAKSVYYIFLCAGNLPFRFLSTLLRSNLVWTARQLAPFFYFDIFASCVMIWTRHTVAPVYLAVYLVIYAKYWNVVLVANESRVC